MQISDKENFPLAPEPEKHIHKHTHTTFLVFDGEQSQETVGLARTHTVEEVLNE